MRLIPRIRDLWQIGDEPRPLRDLPGFAQKMFYYLTLQMNYSFSKYHLSLQPEITNSCSLAHVSLIS